MKGIPMHFAYSRFRRNYGLFDYSGAGNAFQMHLAIADCLNNYNYNNHNHHDSHNNQNITTITPKKVLVILGHPHV